MAINFDERNYRKHSDRNKNLIKKSLVECGAGRSILVDSSDRVIAGNGVFEQASKLNIPVRVVETDGSELVVVKRTDLKTDDERRKQLAVMDNSTSDSSEFDVELLSSDFSIDELKDFGVEIVDVDVDNICDEDDGIPDNVITRCKSGDVWILGEHRLMCGDSTKVDDVIKLMDGQQANLLLTDPPYNVDYQGATKDRLKIKNDSQSDSSFANFLKSAFAAADCVMKDGAAFYIWHSDSEGYNFRNSCREVGWKVRQCLIWNKNAMVIGRQDYQWKHEPCLYGWKDGASHIWNNDRKQTTVIDWDKPQRNEYHPTMKPVGIFGYLISNSTNIGDIVMDIFGGSGTSIVACEQLNRRCYMMELDERYCDVIIQRWENLSGKKAVKKMNVRENG